jgi:hypothetical protein
MRVFIGQRFQVDTDRVPNNKREAIEERAFVVDSRPFGRFSRNNSRAYTYSDAIATAEWLNEAHKDGRIS